MEVNFESDDKKVKIGIKSMEKTDNCYKIPLESIANRIKFPFSLVNLLKGKAIDTPFELTIKICLKIVGSKEEG